MSLGGLFLLLALILASIGYGMMLYKTTQASSMRGFILNLAHTRLDFIPNYIKGMLSKPEHLFLDIKHTDFQKIAYYRKISIDRGIILADVKQEKIPAKITHNNAGYKVNLNMTGQNLDHLGDADKWSLRVKVKGNNTIFGMKEFSLLVPNGRGSPYGHPVNEWVCHEFEKKEGIIALRYDFVDVTINGKYIGVYALEEHFGKRLVEHNNLREGILFKQKLADIAVYNERKVLANPTLKVQLSLLKTLWKSFVVKDIPTSKLFDIDKLAKHYAITDLVNGHHTHWPGNLFFYFNPITRLVEPIGREWQSPYHKEPIHKDSPLYLEKPQYSPIIHEKIFGDPIFVKRYIAELDRMSKPEYLDNFFEKINDTLQAKINILNRDYAAISYSNDYLYDSQKHIRNKLYFEFNEGYNKAIIIAYHDNSDKDNNLNLKCLNLHGLPIEIINVTSHGTIIFEPLDNTLLPGNPDGNNSRKYQNFIFETPDKVALSDSILNDLKINYQILGTRKIWETVIFPWPYQDINIHCHLPITNESDYFQHEFISEDQANKLIVIKPGDWKLKQNLIIPKGFRFVCRPGTRLDLLNTATIISYSPLLFSGTERKPIHIYSSDASGQGILVIKSDKQSLLEYVHFDNLSNPSHGGWTLTGAVNFYESPVNIRFCKFLNNRSEDGLNIIRSEFLIDHSYFYNTFSDAFDADFCTGKITNSAFEKCGNDAVDVSGSRIELLNISINHAGDKGISVGENSSMLAQTIKITNAKLAVASKDMSELNLQNATLSSCKIGYAAYQKKPEFGPAFITVEAVTHDKIETLLLIEKQSTLVINGRKNVSNQKNLQQHLLTLQ